MGTEYMERKRYPIFEYLCKCNFNGRNPTRNRKDNTKKNSDSACCYQCFKGQFDGKRF